MLPYSTDISVLLLFHARADHFAEVWQAVKAARPARLFLYQDGPRLVDAQGKPCKAEESKDWPGIVACRQLVADDNIDWQCDVHRLYQTKNYGCDPSEFLSQQWAFSLTDKCIVLEDDDVPAPDFFPFCKEMLDRYEDDDRIEMIAGFNTESEAMQQAIGNDSYFFSRAFSIWGWASWARVVKGWQGDYAFVSDPQQLSLLRQKARQYRQRRDMVSMCIDHARQGKEYYETIFWADMMLHDRLAIFARANLINNIGMDGGTHYSAQLHLLPRRLRWQFEMPTGQLTFPLTHPAAVEENPLYQQLFYLRNAWNNPVRKVQYSLEELWLNLRHGNIANIRRAIVNRVRKTLRLNRYR